MAEVMVVLDMGVYIVVGVAGLGGMEQIRTRGWKRMTRKAG
jgi:hypothetical protein